MELYVGSRLSLAKKQIIAVTAGPGSIEVEFFLGLNQVFTELRIIRATEGNYINDRPLADQFDNPNPK